MLSTHGKTLRALDGPVLVTGHTGFKGTWLTLLLEKLGVEVVGVSLPAKKNSLYQRADRFGKIQEVFLDLRDFDKTLVAVRDFKPAAIFHLAAQPLVLESYKAPRETFETNVMGTVNILDAAFEVKTTKIVACATTDKVYRNKEEGKSFKESDALGGKDPYSSSKVGAEAAIASWQQISRIKNGPKVVSLRAGNVIGGGDLSEDRLLPDIIRGFMENSKVIVRNPLSSRPWQHVLDPLLGYLMSVEKILNGIEIDAINFGPDQKSLNVNQVIEIVNKSKILGVIPNLEMPSTNSDQNIESQFLDLDSGLANKVIGWSPFWSQSKAIHSTLSWWNSVLNQNLSCEEACMRDLEKIIKYS